MPRWAKAEIEYLENNAQSETSQEIGKAIGRTSSAIRSFASKHNISLQKGSKWEESEDELLKEYAGEMKVNEIAKELGKNRNAVLYRASKLGISLKSSGGRFNRKYSVNHSYFSQIDSKTKAYWLGVMWADGSVYKQKVPRGVSHAIKLEVQFGDKSWIEDFAQDINADYPIKKTHKNQAVRLRMFSKQLFKNLVEHGVIPRKSYSHVTPNIKAEFIPHFIRGVFDGDGSIYQLTRGSLGVNITNTKETCTWTKKNVDRILEIETNVRQKAGDSIAFRWSLRRQEKIPKFIKWIYNDSNRFLKRKYDKAKLLGVL